MPNTTENGDVICKVCPPSQQQSAKPPSSDRLFACSNSSAPFHYVSYCFSSQIKGLLGVRVPTQNSLLAPEESIPETDCHTEELGFDILPQFLLSGVEIQASSGLAFQPRPWHHEAGLGYHASHGHCLWMPTALCTPACSTLTSQDRGQIPVPCHSSVLDVIWG